MPVVAFSIECIMQIFNEEPGRHAWSWKKQAGGFKLLLLLVLCLSLAACTDQPQGQNPSSSKSSGGTSTQATQQSLQQLRWCGTTFMVFRDLGASGTPAATLATPTATATSTATVTPAALINWQQFKAGLKFTIYLPATLPQGTCLISASGTLHDPVLGSSFTIGYLYPDHSSLSFSEAPVQSQNGAFQCSISTDESTKTKGSTPTATVGPAQPPQQLCSGVKEKTNIVFAARGTNETLQQFFQNLQPDVDWIPAK